MTNKFEEARSHIKQNDITVVENEAFVKD